MSATDNTFAMESELLLIQEAARVVANTDDPEAAIQSILRLLSQLLGLNRGRVLLADQRTNALGIRYAYGLTDEERRRGRYALGEGVTGRVFQSGQVALIQNIDDEPAYLRRAIDRGVLPSEPVSYIALPIQQQDRTIGVLAVHRLRQRERPFQRDLTLLRVIATLIAQVLRVSDLVAERTAHLLSENRLLKNRLESRGAAYGIIGASHALHQAIHQSLQVASTNTTVLLLGESGTGKERFARMQHLASRRNTGPFISVNCAAIPAALIESELFGHEKGAFTGAHAAKLGRMELASGGTLFLDEIGDLDLELQAKLLRVLENKLIQRVGGTRDIPVDVRIIAATHKNLQEAVNDNRFRLDLFYRLNVFPIRLPPLRARHGDVPLLARHFLNSANQEYDRSLVFGPGALEALEHFAWPGNIRQLENLVKRAVLMSPAPMIERELIEQILSEEAAIHQPLLDPPSPPAAHTLSAGSIRHTQHPSPPAPSPVICRPGMRGATPPEVACAGAVSGQTLPSDAGAGSWAGQAAARRGAPEAEAFTESAPRPYAWVREDERTEILAALKRCRGNKTRAALSLGLTPRQLRYRMSKLSIQI
jgi:Nif-specific regulatory protein